MDTNGVVLAVGAILLATTVKKFTDFLKFLTNGDWNGLVTQLAVWGGAIGAVVVIGESQFADSVVVSLGMNLSNMDLWTKIVAGIGIGSGASHLFDRQNAIDNSASAVTPSLVPGIDPDPPHPVQAE